MPDCIFCKIVAGELPASVIASEQRAIAFMDINPATRGHALVIPRTHSRDIHDTAEEDLLPVHRHHVGPGEQDPALERRPVRQAQAPPGGDRHSVHTSR